MKQMIVDNMISPDGQAEYIVESNGIKYKYSADGSYIGTLNADDKFINEKECKMKHAHSELLIAWANDNTLKFECKTDYGWAFVEYPTFIYNVEYRIRLSEKQMKIERLEVKIDALVDELEELRGVML
jgi:hypothetical protein